MKKIFNQILQNITYRKFAKYYISKNLRNITYWKFTEYYVLKICELLRIKNLRTITFRKFVNYYVSKICELLRIENMRTITYWKFAKIFENLRYITLYVILRWVWKLTKFLRAKICVSFRTKKFPDVWLSVLGELQVQC